MKLYGLGFQNRKHTKAPPDLAIYDDSLIVEFDAKHITTQQFKTLLGEAIPAFVEAMHPYRIVLDESTIGTEDARITLPDGASVPRPDFLDPRVGVNRIWPVNYWDRELSLRSFGLVPEEVVQRLTAHVAEARILNDGALIIDSCEIPTIESIRLIDARLRAHLLAK